MAVLFQLEEFNQAETRSVTTIQKPIELVVTEDAEDLEKAKLSGYETGYQAGWDDCVKTEADGQNRIGVEFARNLQELGFTFHEARSHVMHGLEPLLLGVIEKVLPNLVSLTIGQTILEEILPMASMAADNPIEIVIPPSARAAIEPILNEASTTPFTLIDEPTLADGQIFLRSGQTEKQLDLGDVIERIRTAIDDLYSLNEKAFKHG